MDIAMVLLRQICIMVLLVCMGFWMFRRKIITMTGNKELGALLVNLVMPCVVLNSYITEFSVEKLSGLGISFAAAAVTMLISILASRLQFGKKQPIEHFGAAFSNAGFIGLPLIQAAFGSEAVFYVASYVALLNALQWTYGVYIMSGNKQAISIKKITTNPVIIGLVLGIIIFVAQIPLPYIVKQTISMTAGLNAPIAMIILGVYFANMKFRDLFNEKSAYLCTLSRLIIIPVLSFLVLCLLPGQYYLIKMAVLIASSAPVGVNVAIFAQLNGLDYSRAVKSVCLSTVISIVTLPVIVGLASWFW